MTNKKQTEDVTTRIAQRILDKVRVIRESLPVIGKASKSKRKKKSSKKISKRTLKKATQKVIKKTAKKAAAKKKATAKKGPRRQSASTKKR